MQRFDVKRTDCHSFFGWSNEDENRLRAVPAAVADSDEPRPFGDPGRPSELVGVPSESDDLQLMVVGLKTPENLGSILRICACFAVGRVHHVGLSHWSFAPPAEAAPSAEREQHAVKGSGTAALSKREFATMQRVAVGCDTLVARRQWSINELGAFLDAHPSADDRLPLIAVETADGAVPLPSFVFPRRCVIVAGAEGSGIDVKLLRRLRPGFDAMVYIPMPGPHKSLNVAEAISCAIYEYRRQWPDQSRAEAVL